MTIAPMEYLLGITNGNIEPSLAELKTAVTAALKSWDDEKAALKDALECAREYIEPDRDWARTDRLLAKINSALLGNQSSSPLPLKDQP